MRKNIKKIIFSFLVALLVMSVSLTVSAASSQTGTLAGKNVYGSVSINANQGSASTSISLAPNSGSTVTVSLSYSYVNVNTDVVSKLTGGANGNIAASATRTKPNSSSYRSWRAQATHKVTYSGQTWNANTERYY